MITDVLSLVSTLKQGTNMPWRQLASSLELPYGTLMRWKGRREQSKPLVRRPGPAKVVPFDATALEKELRGLPYSPKRTVGTTAVYQRHRYDISRRDFYFTVKMTRYDAYLEHKRNLRRIAWLAPGVIWSVDDTQYGYDAEGRSVNLHQILDLASSYTFNPITGDMASGETSAGYLDHLFGTYGAPLFFKRDNAGNLNGQAVNDVFNQYLVIPLNSPPHYPPYNGSIEHTQREVKDVMRDKLRYKPDCPGVHLCAYAECSVNDLNHQPRKKLNWKTSCHVFWGQKDNYRFTKPERRAIYDLILLNAERILNQMQDHSQRSIDSAWRIAVETFLRSKGFITVSINGKVLPNLNPVWTHY